MTHVLESYKCSFLFCLLHLINGTCIRKFYGKNPSSLWHVSESDKFVVSLHFTDLYTVKISFFFFFFFRINGVPIYAILWA